MNPEVWNLLHDGVVVRMARTADSARLTVSAPHLAAEFGGDAFELVLGGVTRLAYQPYSRDSDEPWLEEPDAIARAAPELTEAELEEGELRVFGPGGMLATRYDTLVLEVNGAEVPIEALRKTVASFWVAWRKTHGMD